MTDEKIIAKQTREIEMLKAIQEEHEDRFSTIHNIIYCCSGPLNGNVDGFSKKQMMVFNQITHQLPR